VDSRGRTSDTSIDAALPAAASMRPDRRNPGCPASARDRRRWAGVPRLCAAWNQASAIRRVQNARKVRRSADDDRWLRHHNPTLPECALGPLDVGRNATHQDFDTPKGRRRDLGTLVHTQLRLFGGLRWRHFLNQRPSVASADVIAANVSDGGSDCRRHNNNRLDTRSIQDWINDTLRRQPNGN